MEGKQRIFLKFFQKSVFLIEVQPLNATWTKIFFSKFYGKVPGCCILVTFPSYWKKVCSILRFWFEKLNCGYFHSFHSWKKTHRIIFSSTFWCSKKLVNFFLSNVLPYMYDILVKQQFEIYFCIFFLKQSLVKLNCYVSPKTYHGTDTLVVTVDRNEW